MIGAPAVTLWPAFTWMRATRPSNGARTEHCAICASAMRTWACARSTAAAASDTSISAADCNPCSLSFASCCRRAAWASANATSRRATASAHSKRTSTRSGVTASPSRASTADTRAAAGADIVLSCSATTSRRTSMSDVRARIAASAGGWATGCATAVGNGVIAQRMAIAVAAALDPTPLTSR